MSMLQFLENAEWDAPFFKRLALNDTGQGRGHQAGMVFPKSLRRYLPTLNEAEANNNTPTVNRRLYVEMFIHTNPITESTVRYQLQTWGGTRLAESRLTDGLRPLRDQAGPGDIMIFQRKIDALDCFRLVLIKQGTPEFKEIKRQIDGHNWGVLNPRNVPINQEQVGQAQAEITAITQEDFVVQRPHVIRLETKQRRIARSSVFRERVRQEYGFRCAVSGFAITTPNRLQYEVESAHIVPVTENGPDDIRNGLTLTQTLHWAFDQGLFGIRADRTIYVPDRVLEMPENNFLQQINNRRINEARTETLRVHDDAFGWHMAHRVRKWDNA